MIGSTQNTQSLSNLEQRIVAYISSHDNNVIYYDLAANFPDEDIETAFKNLIGEWIGFNENGSYKVIKDYWQQTSLFD